MKLAITLPALKLYAEQLGVSFELRIFDGGQTVYVGGAQPRRFTYMWGDDEAYWLGVILRYLHGLPWPTEDDPRVATEGVTL